MDRFNVYGSSGVLTVDSETGVVKDYTPEGSDDSYKDIASFDVDEWKETYPGEDISKISAIDILDLGYWTIDGDYIQPDEDWREMIKAEKEGAGLRKVEEEKNLSDEEFPGSDVPAEVRVALTSAGFEDSSWRNDIAPSFVKKTDKFMVYIFVRASTDILDVPFSILVTDLGGAEVASDTAETAEDALKKAEEFGQNITEIKYEAKEKPKDKINPKNYGKAVPVFVTKPTPDIPGVGGAENGEGSTAI